MKYYLIVGEASGDLHASHLMRALKHLDADASFRFFGGDMMAAEGGTLVRHYRELAFMGIVPVLMHLPTILRNMSVCKQDITQWHPDVVILVDYPGFNLDIARYVKKHTHIPVYYYISPKIWAWKEYRIKRIKRDVDELFSILPFEVPFFEGKHHYPIHYVGNPTADEVAHFRNDYHESREDFCRRHHLSARPLLAILPGSREHEIRENLPKMLQAATVATSHDVVVAGAPGADRQLYAEYLPADTHIIYGETFALLSHAHAALVTSGTATLETALFRVPQVVCYHMRFARIVSWGRHWVLKVPYVSLVNLIAGREVVKELVAADFTVERTRQELAALIHDGVARQRMLKGYDQVHEKLGERGAADHAARLITALLAYR